MTGFEKLKEMIKDQEDTALKQTVEYLLSRKDMEEKYLNTEKNIEEMCEYIQSKGRKHSKNGWNYITNEVVYAWAVMYWSFPNTFLKIAPKKEIKNDTSKKSSKTTNTNNVVSIEDAKKKLEEKNEVKQISLFGGAT